jgi:hypothetical protein
MPEEAVRVVHYSRAALLTSLVKMKTATGLWEPDNRHMESFILGSDGKAAFEDEDECWRAVRKHLQEIMVENPYYPRPEKILLVGDLVQDEGFQEVFKKAMIDIMGTLPPTFEKDVDVVAARGAAELRRRKPAQ